MDRLEQEVEQELERFCAEMKAVQVRAVLLFGSRVRGQHTEESDADVCLIADGLPDNLFQRRYPAPSGYRHLSVFGPALSSPENGKGLELDPRAVLMKLINTVSARPL